VRGRSSVRHPVTWTVGSGSSPSLSPSSSPSLSPSSSPSLSPSSSPSLSPSSSPSLSPSSSPSLSPSSSPSLSPSSSPSSLSPSLSSSSSGPRLHLLPAHPVPQSRRGTAHSRWRRRARRAAGRGVLRRRPPATEDHDAVGVVVDEVERVRKPRPRCRRRPDRRPRGTRARASPGRDRSPARRGPRARVAEDRLRDAEQATHAARERLDAPIAGVAEPDPVERRVRVVADEARVERERLAGREPSRNGTRCGRYPIGFGPVAPGWRTSPAVGAVAPTSTEEGRLSRSVRADHGGETRFDRKRHRVEYRHAAVRPGDIRQGGDGLVRHR